MGLLVRMLQSLPLMIALIILAIIIYFVVSWMHSPTKAKEVLIRFFTVIGIAISGLFLLASLYALIDGNQIVFELTVSFMAVGLIALIITRICRWRFVKNHPHYKERSMRVHFIKHKKR